MLELNTIGMVLITANQMRLYTRKIPLTSSMKSIHPHYLATAEFLMREFTHYLNNAEVESRNSKKLGLNQFLTYNITFN